MSTALFFKLFADGVKITNIHGWDIEGSGKLFEMALGRVQLGPSLMHIILLNQCYWTENWLGVFFNALMIVLIFITYFMLKNNLHSKIKPLLHVIDKIPFQEASNHDKINWVFRYSHPYIRSQGTKRGTHMINEINSPVSVEPRLHPGLQGQKRFNMPIPAFTPLGGSCFAFNQAIDGSDNKSGDKNGPRHNALSPPGSRLLIGKSEAILPLFHNQSQGTPVHSQQPEQRTPINLPSVQSHLGVSRFVYKPETNHDIKVPSSYQSGYTPSGSNFSSSENNNANIPEKPEEQKESPNNDPRKVKSEFKSAGLVSSKGYTPQSKQSPANRFSKFSPFKKGAVAEPKKPEEADSNPPHSEVASVGSASRRHKRSEENNTEFLHPNHFLANSIISSRFRRDEEWLDKDHSPSPSLFGNPSELKFRQQLGENLFIPPQIIINPRPNHLKTLSKVNEEEGAVEDDNADEQNKKYQEEAIQQEPEKHGDHFSDSHSSDIEENNYENECQIPEEHPGQTEATFRKPAEYGDSHDMFLNQQSPHNVFENHLSHSLVPQHSIFMQNDSLKYSKEFRKPRPEKLNLKSQSETPTVAKGGISVESVKPRESRYKNRDELSASDVRLQSDDINPSWLKPLNVDDSSYPTKSSSNKMQTKITTVTNSKFE